MIPKSRIGIFLLAIIVGLSLFSSKTYASKSIAKISEFKGKVVILSGKKLLKVTQVGQILNEGDRVEFVVTEGQKGPAAADVCVV